MFGLISLLTLNQIPASGQPYERPTIPEFEQYVKQVSQKYGMDPAVSLALAEVESSKDKQRFRFGRVGRYWLPFGIHKDCAKGHDLSDWRVNTEVGIRAIARYKDLRKSLKKYNASFNEAYYRRVLTLAAKNRKEKVFR